MILKLSSRWRATFWRVALATMLAGLANAAGAQTAPTQKAPTEPGPAHTVRLFNLLCVSKLPKIETIAEIARSQGFTPVTGAALQRYQPEVPAEVLKVWRFKDLGAGFTLVVAQSQPDARFKKSFPDFASSTNYACSLIPAKGDPAVKVQAEMTRLIGRAADESFDQGPLAVNAWLAKTDEILIQAFHYALKARSTTRLLSASLFVKR